jgi:hypothetical protein
VLASVSKYQWQGMTIDTVARLGTTAAVVADAGGSAGACPTGTERPNAELPSTGDATKARVKEIIGRYPPWAKAHSPGHVNGMQVKRAPVHGSWAHDARDGWKALDDLLGEEFEPPSSVVPKKKAKRTASEDVDEPDIEPGWRLLPLVRGRTAILLGGDPREPNRERLERAFQLASLEWPSIEGPRKVEAAVERIRRAPTAWCSF